MDDSQIINPDIYGGCVYYSQNREDLILKSFFPDIKRGFYVDVGAFDPDLDSVTKLFYLEGWTGINIEPQPDKYMRFQQLRKKDTNLNLGVADKEGSLTLRVYNSSGLSTFSQGVKGSYLGGEDSDTKKYKDVIVKVTTLTKVFKDAAPKTIHFLKVDVEGLEYEVLASNDWTNYRPQVICVESNHTDIKKDWRKILKDSDYELTFFDGLNEYYADKHAGRGKKLDYVKDVVHDRGGGLRYEHYNLMMRLYEQLAHKTNHVKELELRLRNANDAHIKNVNSVTWLLRRIIIVGGKRVLRRRAS